MRVEAKSDCAPTYVYPDSRVSRGTNLNFVLQTLERVDGGLPVVRGAPEERCMRTIQPTSRVCGRFAAWALLLLACGSLSAAETSRISGRVLDPKGATVASARVTLRQCRRRRLFAKARPTLKATLFSTESIAGQYQLTAEATSFLTVVANVSVAAGQSTSIGLAIPADCLLHPSRHGCRIGTVVAYARSRAEYHHPRPGTRRQSRPSGSADLHPGTSH